MIAVLDYGIGNLRSAEKAFEHLGADVVLATRPEQAAGATGVVLPGVGAFGACVRALRASGLDAVARGAIADGRPFLGICVGYQMLFDGSEENPGEPGLGVVGGIVERLGGDVRLPQMQWNTLRLTGAPSEMLAAGDAWVYFVHSYVPQPAEDARPFVVATTEYGEEFPVAIERGNLWGVQFHPEKSGRDGLAILERFARRCERRDRATA